MTSSSARLAAATLATLVLVACSGPETSTEPSPPADPVPSGGGEDPGEQDPGEQDPGEQDPGTEEDPGADAPATRWVCHPDQRRDPCTAPLTVASLGLDGDDTTTEVRADADAPVDCFYVYPTVSDAPASNAPRRGTPVIRAVTRAQAAPLAQSCRVYAPAYAQATTASLRDGTYFSTPVQQRADDDVRAAWADYLEQHNDGRGVVLVGHSQGAMVLDRMLSDVVLGDAAQRDLIVSALLIGGNHQRVQAGESLPPCEAPGQTGCVVAYSSYQGRLPETALFGSGAVCTDPAVLAGRDAGLLDPWLPAVGLTGDSGGGVEVPAGSAADAVRYPGSLRGQCREERGFAYLSVSPVEGARTPTLPQTFGQAWGLHVADVNLATGDLVEAVRLQAEGWAR